ncbi:MAG: hypothetical protein ACR2PO_00410 [Methyloligellaceae bacterium]
MTRALAIVAVAACSSWATPVTAQALPQWNLRVTCAKELDPACRAFEANAYSRLSGEWRSISAQIKKICLDDAESFGHESYRLLQLCLEDALVKRRSAPSEDLGSPEWVSDGLRLLFR